jgi:MtrB/PioB family decaheme-associated outer membrane protein
MKTTNRKLAISSIALAVQGALFAMMSISAQAQDASVADLTTPDNNIEIGVTNASKASTKFGEYNGLNKDGASLIGNFSIKGGSGYTSSDSLTRWSVSGQDIGTNSRSADASISNQGQWSIGIGIDQLRHYTTTNYQTPYVGSMGGNTFTLPANFGGINTSQSATGGSGGATLLGGRSLNNTQLGDFGTKDVYTQRDNTKFSAGYDFNQNLNFRFDFNHLEQSGAKLIGSGTDPATALTGSYAGIATWGKEVPVILMNPTQYKTDTLNAAFNWTGEKGHASIGYFGSLFHDQYNGISWANPFNTSAQTGTYPGTSGTIGLPMSTMSTPPSNQFHQFNMTGGYTINQTTKLVGGFSYALNTQNDNFAGTYTPGFALNLPSDSLNGKVTMTHLDAKLTNQTTKDLTLSAALKYNERDNKTGSSLFSYYDEGNKFREAWSAPMSNRKTQLELAGDYRLTLNQKLHFGYEFEKVQRWCNNSPSYNQIISALTAAGQFTAPQITQAQAYYANGTDCAQVPESTENRLVASYRLKASDTVNFNAGYTYNDRQATVNTSFYNPMQSVSEGFENPGFVAFFQGSRRENLLKAGVNWQASDKLNFGLSAKYRKDDYYDHTYGVTNGKLSGFNIDASYAMSSSNTLSAYASWQNRSRDLYTEAGRTIAVSGTTATPGTFWGNHLGDQDVTFGISGKQTNVYSGRLDLSEDLTYSVAQTDYNTTTYYTPTPGTSAGCGPTSNMSCGSPPTIKSAYWQLKLAGNYHVDKKSSVMFGYTFQHLTSNDYFYNAYQYPYGLTSGMPTNQQAPSYNQSVAYAAYSYSFK